MLVTQDYKINPIQHDTASMFAARLGCSFKDAVAYLVAEEWHYGDAAKSYRADTYVAPGALVVFTSYSKLTALHPTVSAEFELRQVEGGAIYPVRITGKSIWVGEPCDNLVDAERVALGYLRGAL